MHFGGVGFSRLLEVSTAVFILALTCLAGWLPVRRAAAADPAVS